MNLFQRISSFFSSAADMALMGIHAMSNDPKAWEGDIRKFEKRDRLIPPPEHPVVFTGSSSFTLWKTLEQEMAPLPAINRGFGGSKMADVVFYVDRIVIPYQPRAVVLFAGTNDIAYPRPKTAREVYEGYLAFVNCVQAALPETPIYYVSITPTPSRWKLWPVAFEANCLIWERALTDPRLRFIDLTPVILGKDGKPDRTLFRADRLHPNALGYQRWLGAIKPALTADLLPGSVSLPGAQPPTDS